MTGTSRWDARIGVCIGAHGTDDEAMGVTLLDVFEPLTEPIGTVVTLHGAGGRREDLTQFAAALAASGLRAWNVQWRRPGAPARLADFDRHLAAVMAHLEQADVGPCSIVAWSDAVLPLALAVLDGPEIVQRSARAAVGLGGYYGWRGAVSADLVHDEATAAFFGGGPDAVGRWRSPLEIVGSGMVEVDHRVPLHVVAGDRDFMRPRGVDFHGALRTAGWPTTIRIVEECDHYGLVIPRLTGGAATLDHVVGLVGSPKPPAMDAAHRGDDR